jgi:cytochrome c oxidase cbb3-type subunit 3
MVQEIDGKLTKTEPLESEGHVIRSLSQGSLTIICRHGVFVLCINSFLELFIWFDTKFELIIEMELKRSRSSKIDIAEYMKTAPDMMDEKLH